MTRSFHRWLVTAVAVFAVSEGVIAQVRPPAGNGMIVEPTPDFETLRRLAQQLGGSGGLPDKIDPEMMKFAQEFLKNNPDFLNRPDVQQRAQEMRQQFQQNPQLAEQFKLQSGFDPEQFRQFRQRLQSGGGGTTPNGPNAQPPTEFKPPKIDGMPPQPQNPAPSVTPQVPPGTIRQFPTPQTPQAQQQAAQGNQGYNQVVNFWEANVGPLDNTPALKQSLVEMFSGGGQNPLGGMSGNGLNGLNGTGTGPGGKPFFDTSGAGSGTSGFANWFNGMTSNGGPGWWKSLTGGSKGWFGGGGGSSGFTPPSAGGFGGAPSFAGVSGVGVSGLGTVGLVLAALLVLTAVGFLVYRYWPAIQAMRDRPTPIAGLGEWPIDPRQVTDRESLVKVFEYFSVFLCGDGARVWNHVTIAEAFRENVPASAPFADHLARLYAVARYTPAREEISPADLAAARRHLCTLAGVREG